MKTLNLMIKMFSNSMLKADELKRIKGGYGDGVSCKVDKCKDSNKTGPTCTGTGCYAQDANGSTDGYCTDGDGTKRTC